MKDYKDPYGLWSVSTEGDDEGASMVPLGVYSGKINTIAFALADKALYSLHFTKIDPTIPAPTKLRKSVSVVLDNESGTQSMNPEERVEFFNALLGNEDISVTKGQFYGSVWFNREIPKSEIQRVALAKLTDEEKIALGLA